MLYIPRAERIRVADLFALDAALGNVVRTTREPMVGRIKLAWWRERLEEIDQCIVPAEPQLEATAELVAQTALTGAGLAGLVDRWGPLLEAFPWNDEVVGAVADRGAFLFGHAATILGTEQAQIATQAGSLWSLLDVAKHCSDELSRTALIETARGQLGRFHTDSVDTAIRPLTMLGLLARRDVDRWPEIEPEATPGRAWVMIRHRLTGKL